MYVSVCFPAVSTDLLYSSHRISEYFCRLLEYFYCSRARCPDDHRLDRHTSETRTLLGGTRRSHWPPPSNTVLFQGGAMEEKQGTAWPAHKNTYFQRHRAPGSSDSESAQTQCCIWVVDVPGFVEFESTSIYTCRFSHRPNRKLHNNSGKCRTNRKSRIWWTYREMEGTCTKTTYTYWL